MNAKQASQQLTFLASIFSNMQCIQHMQTTLKQLKYCIKQHSATSELKAAVNTAIIAAWSVVTYHKHVTKCQCTYQYGVPINESLFCANFAFLAETPKSAKMKNTWSNFVCRILMWSCMSVIQTGNRLELVDQLLWQTKKDSVNVVKTWQHWNHHERLQHWFSHLTAYTMAHMHEVKMITWIVLLRYPKPKPVTCWNLGSGTHAG